MFHTLLVAIDGGPQTRRIAELARQEIGRAHV